MAIAVDVMGGDNPLEVRIEAAVRAINDFGIVIKKNEIENIFKRFYCVDKSHSKMTGGTGLGLSIVKHIVNVHKGKIDVESQLGKGSTFTISIPK